MLYESAKLKQDELRDLFVSQGENYALIRIPKTASASMARGVFNATFKNSRSSQHIDSTEYEAPSKWWDHYSARFCIETLGIEKWDNAFTFGVVRNPWSRLYSIWKYWHCTAVVSSNVPADTLKFADISFADWIMDGCIQTAWTEPHHSQVFPQNPVLSQFNWIGSENDQYLVDVTLRLEELDEHGVHILRRVFGDNFRMPSDRMNATSVVNEYKYFYTPKLIECVGDLCNDDIMKFKYTFDGIA
jgi:hypothetical protein